jgi:putative ABC transport system permease protein
MAAGWNNRHHIPCPWDVVVLHSTRFVCLVLLGAVLAGCQQASRKPTDTAAIRQARTIVVRSVKPLPEAPDGDTARYGLTNDDYERFKKIEAVASIAPLRIFPDEVRNLERTLNARVVATLPDYYEVSDIQLAAGRFLTDQDNNNEENVAVLGAKVVDTLFPFDDPVGQPIRLGTAFYRIVGTLREQSPQSAAGAAEQPRDPNHDVYIPLKTCNARFGERIVTRQPGRRSVDRAEVHQIVLVVSRNDQVASTADELRRLLATSHKSAD